MDLYKIAVIGGGVIALGGGFYFTRRIQDNFRSQPYYKESCRLLRHYRPAVDHLGEPILAKSLDLGTKGANYSDGLDAKLTIPLKGPKNKAVLYSWSSRPTAKDKWRIDKLDLELKDRGVRWTFYLHPDSSQVKTKVLPDGTVLTSPPTESEGGPETKSTTKSGASKDTDTDTEFLYIDPKNS